MVQVICDVGVKNFCYVVFDKSTNTMIDFDVCSFRKKNFIQDLLALWLVIKDRFSPTTIYMEQQLLTNILCQKMETATLAFAVLNSIEFRRVPAKQKFTRLQIPYTDYTDRKKKSIKVGKEMFESQVVASQAIRDRVSALVKQDDFFDCVLMALTVD